MLHCRFPGALMFICRDGRDTAIVERDDQVSIVIGPCGATEPDVHTEYPTIDEAATEFRALVKRELATTP